VVAIAAGRAFTFRYAETDELLRAAGCEPVAFDPVADEQLPAGTAGLYLGGGFPEVHAAELAANGKLRSEIRSAVEAGLPTVAECAGLIYLCRSVDGLQMVGAIEADAVMSKRLTLSYRTMISDHDQLLAAAGTRLTGHEFHRTMVEPESGEAPAWLVDGEPIGFSTDPAGTGRETLHASYLHLHWAGHPDLAQRFAHAVHDHANMRPEPPIIRPEHAIMRPEPKGVNPTRFMIFTTTETPTLPKAWSIWRSTCAYLRPQTGSAQSSTAPPSTLRRIPTPTQQPKPLPRPTTSQSTKCCRLPAARKPSLCWPALFVRNGR
jgi:cobyrinic acid a,c-diamide synthase